MARPASHGGDMTYRISGLDRKHDGQLWVVEAADQMTAAHIAELFRKEGYEKVKVEELPSA